MADVNKVRAMAEDLFASFQAAGAQMIDADILLPAESLLDLYGEDIRARAYVTTDPLFGRDDVAARLYRARGASPYGQRGCTSVLYLYGPRFSQTRSPRGARPRISAGGL